MSRCFATIESKTTFTIQLSQCHREAINEVIYKSSVSGRIITQKLCNFHTKALERRLKKFDEKFNCNSELQIKKI